MNQKIYALQKAVNYKTVNMIFKQEHIAIFSELAQSEQAQTRKIIRLHKPTGVYFATVSEIKSKENPNVFYAREKFSIGETTVYTMPTNLVEEVANFLTYPDTILLNGTHLMKLKYYVDADPNEIQAVENEVEDMGLGYIIVAKSDKSKEVAFYIQEKTTSSSNLLKVGEDVYEVGDTLVREVANFDEIIEFNGLPYKFMYESDDLPQSKINSGIGLEQLGQIENSLTDDGYDFIAVINPNNDRIGYYIPTEMPSSAINTETSSNGSFAYYEVAQLNYKGEIIDKKTFDGKTQKSFFEAVDYFEQLIDKRQPQPEQEDPSIGIFIYFKSKVNNILKDEKGRVIALGNDVLIDYEDIAKVFTPPVKKKYGRLNMYAVENPKYDVIKGKFALKFDEQLTKQYNENSQRYLKTKAFPELEEELFVYKMTPYETSESGEENADPEEVNNEELSLDEIEGEDPKNMTGENAEKDGDGDGEDGDGDGEDGDGDGEDGDGEDGDGKGKGKGKGKGEGEDGEDGEDGDGEDGEDGEGDGKGKGEREGKGEGEFSSPFELEQGEGSAEGESNEQELQETSGSYTGTGTEGQYKETDFERTFKNEVPMPYLRTDRALTNYLDSMTVSELQTTFSTKIESKTEFIKSAIEARQKLNL
jgi:hypothetical protein